jgi:hypothetical protein
MRDSVDGPQLGASLGIVSGDEAAARLGIAAARHALDDLAVDDERAAGIAPALGPVGGGVVPHHLAGLGIERHDVSVVGGGDEIAVVNRKIAGREVATFGQNLRRQVALVFPDQVGGWAGWQHWSAVI